MGGDDATPGPELGLSVSEPGGGQEERQRGAARDVHIDGCEGTVGDGAAEGTGEGEAGVESGTAELGSGGGLRNDGVDLGRARGRGSGHFCCGRDCGRCDGSWPVAEKRMEGRRVFLTLGRRGAVKGSEGRWSLATGSVSMSVSMSSF